MYKRQGLYISHVFIPPTPGPIAAANTLGIGNNLLLVMGMGVLVSIAPLIAGYFYAKYIGKKVRAKDEADSSEVTKTYEQLVAEYGKLPGGFIALAPIVVPIVLMALGSIASMAHWTGFLFDISTFLGTPIIALAVGTVFGVIQMAQAGKMDKFYGVTNDTLKTVGPVSYTHLDVYKRQALPPVTGNGSRVRRHPAGVQSLDHAVCRQFKPTGTGVSAWNAVYVLSLIHI